MDAPVLLWLGIPLVLGLVVLLAILSYRAEKKRREALAAFAAGRGWNFDPGRDSDHDEEYAHFEIFRRGHSRAAYNSMTGSVPIHERAWPCKAGDFTYKVTTHTGKSTQTHTYHFSYLIVHIPFASVPDLLIRPEGIFDKLAGAFGFDDIDFESEEFSRRFYVRSPDKRFAYDVVHPRMMEFLLAAPRTAIDLERGQCCLADGSRRWEPGEFEARLSFLSRFFDLWPEHLLVALEGNP